MRILVLGGDGFCGWPAALHLSQLGHDVDIVDNLSRRRIDGELGTDSLTPIRTPEERIAAWQAGEDDSFTRPTSRRTTATCACPPRAPMYRHFAEQPGGAVLDEVARPEDATRSTTT